MEAEFLVLWVIDADTGLGDDSDDGGIWVTKFKCHAESGRNYQKPLFQINPKPRNPKP